VTVLAVTGLAKEAKLVGVAGVVAVAGGGTDEKSPVTRAGFAENSLPYDGTTESLVIRERAAHVTGRVVKTKKAARSFIVRARCVDALQNGTIAVQQALGSHFRQIIQSAFNVVPVCLTQNASFAQ
jgi:hypothetical protein